MSDANPRSPSTPDVDAMAAHLEKLAVEFGITSILHSADGREHTFRPGEHISRRRVLAALAPGRARDHSSSVRPRVSPRRRGAGRPAVKGAARRSSARSGDSDSEGEPEPPSRRLCLACGADIAHRRAGATTCGATCRRRLARQRASSSYELSEPDETRPRVQVGLAGRALKWVDASEVRPLNPSAVRSCVFHGVIYQAAEGCPACHRDLDRFLGENGDCTVRRPLAREWLGERYGTQPRRLPVHRRQLDPAEDPHGLAYV